MQEPGSTGLVARHIRGLVESTLADTPVTVVQGARQVGKSTLIRQVASGRRATVVSLDLAAAYEGAMADPDGFVRQAGDGLLVIDEVQRVPALLRAVKGAVDADRRPGRFLLTGSADLLGLAGAQESLAGRAETVPLYGLSQGEIAGSREDFLDRLLAGDGATLAARRPGLQRADYLDIVCAGSYPEPRARAGARRGSWFDNYLTRVVSRDAREVSGLHHLDRLGQLVRLIAADTSAELVKSRLAVGSGIPETTLSPYLDLLDSLFLTHRVPSWGANLAKRVTGRQKIALLDTGLAAALNHVTPAALAPGVVSEVAGNLVESFVAGELRRQCGWSERRPELAHFRDRNGLEVDLVAETPDRTVAGIEVKAAMSVGRGDFAGLRFLRDALGERFALGVVLHCGEDAVPFGDRLWALPLGSLWVASP